MTLRRWPSLLLLVPLLYALTLKGSAEGEPQTGAPTPEDAYTLKILKILSAVQKTRLKVPQIVISSLISQEEVAFLPKSQDRAVRRKTRVYRLDPPVATDSYVPVVTGPIICEVNDPPYAQDGGVGNYRRVSTPLYTVTMNQKTIVIDSSEMERPSVAKQLDLFQGQGPEQLSKFRAFPYGTLVSFQGRLQNGDRVLGQVDPAIGYLTTNWAEWKHLRDGSTVMSEFRFSQFKEVKHGFWFPTKITSYIQSGQPEHQGRPYNEYSVDSFVFQPPPLSIFSVNLVNGDASVNDNRFGPPVHYKPSDLMQMNRPGKPVTPESLAALSQARVRTYSRFLAPSIQNVGHPRGGDPRLIVLIATLITGAGVALVSRIGSQKKKTIDSAFDKPSK